MIVDTNTKWNDVLTADCIDFKFKSSERAGKYKELSDMVQSLKAHFASTITDDTKACFQSSRSEYCVMKICEYLKMRFQKSLHSRLDFNSGLKERFATYYAAFRFYHMYHKYLHDKINNKSETLDKFQSMKTEESGKAVSEILNILEHLKYSLDTKN